MSINDDVFKIISELLTKNDINFWVCHGTLLGIIRESRILPWDHDIDFAVWDHETDKNSIIDILTSNGFQQELFSSDMDCLHFFGEDKKIDISFYKIKNDVASIKWAIPSEKITDKLILFVSQILLNQRNILNEYNFTKKLILYPILLLTLFFKYFLSNDLKNSFIIYARNRIEYKGYSYPVDILKKKYIDYDGIKIPVPINSEECLKYTYGVDWMIPKKNFIWYKEAEHLITLS